MKSWERPERLLLLKGWARDGLRMAEIAQKCGVSISTLYRWKKSSERIGIALEKNRELADRAIEDALYQRARGYTVTLQKQIKCKQIDYDPSTGKKTKEWEQVVPVQEQVHIAANMTAMQFWLKNRKPNQWNSKASDPFEATEEVEIVDDI